MNGRTSQDTELLAAANNPDSPTCLSVTVPLTRQEVAVDPAEPGCLGRVVAGPAWWGSPDNPPAITSDIRIRTFSHLAGQDSPGSQLPTAAQRGDCLPQQQQFDCLYISSCSRGSRKYLRNLPSSQSVRHHYSGVISCFVQN